MSGEGKPNVAVGLVQVCAAMGTILSVTLSRVPNAVLRSKFAASSEILCSLVEEHAEQVRSLLQPIVH